MSTYKIYLTSLVILLSISLNAKENIGQIGKANKFAKLAVTCSPASDQTNLEINNIRTAILNGGDMWWDLNDAKYEVPKIEPAGSAPSVHSLFAGAVWLAGVDAGGQLKTAAQTYRQNGNDFWPGPLNNIGNVTEQTCNEYDRHFEVFGEDIDDHRAYFDANSGGQRPLADIPSGILEWPGLGNVNSRAANGDPLQINQDLAPFYDYNENGYYDPENGDFPVIGVKCFETGFGTSDAVYGDQMIFWVYNDKGDVHGETGGQAIGIEIGALAFAFKTSDEINNMTFYRYEIRNKATSRIGDFYMGQWVDPDLGCFNNDFVGCDTSRDMGVCYNGTPTDPDCASRGYGANPPLVATVYFEGPLADPDPNDPNAPRGKLGMSTFTYYDNDFSVRGNPEQAIHYYNYMRGFWKDNTPFTYGGNAYGGSVPTPFMFPGDPSEPSEWSECSVPNTPADRRFLQSSGPFTLQPGDLNTITVGVVWNRPIGYSCGSFDAAIGNAADKALSLFDNCFKLIDGPDAPTLVIREMSNELVISLVNNPSSNNVGQSYDEESDDAVNYFNNVDNSITDLTYTFQGYILYQLKNASVSVEDLNDPTQARVVAQVDIRDDVDKIVNYVSQPDLSPYPIPELKVEGNNDDIRTTFQITDDLFGEDGSQLVNHKTYYYTAIAYAYNNFVSYDPVLSPDGQQQPYLQGRRNVSIYTGIPHQPEPGSEGTVLNSAYGDMLPITRIEGAGNGGYSLNLTDESVQNILNNGNFYGPVEYEGGSAPIEAMVYDPFKVKDVDFRLSFSDSSFTDSSVTKKDSILSTRATWTLEISDGNVLDIIPSERDIEVINQQLIQDYGISIRIKQVAQNCDSTVPVSIDQGNVWTRANGFIEAEKIYEDPQTDWLGGIEDQSTNSYFNWIRSGNYREQEPDQGEPTYRRIFDDYNYRTTEQIINETFEEFVFWDENEQFNSILEGTWAPYSLAAYGFDDAIPTTLISYPNGAVPARSKDIHGPGFFWQTKKNFLYSSGGPTNQIHSLQSVDVVFTDDRSKWTRCVVLETSGDSLLSEGNAIKGHIRQSPSLDINFTSNIQSADTGRSWFPGYAINVETGQRLNIMFGESSWLQEENGRDMIWNPTSNQTSPLFNVLFGGKHYIYIMETPYDEGAEAQRILLDNFNKYTETPISQVPSSERPQFENLTLRDNIYDKIMWVSMPVVNPGYELKSPEDGLIPTETTVKLRVNTPYQKFEVTSENDGFPLYAFSTEGLGVEHQLVDVAKDALDEIRVVPNPYYAYSAYETNQLDNRVKITNLPDECTVSIFTLGGTLIRQFERDINSTTSVGSSSENNNLDNSIDWDLRNNKRILVSSGVYLIHVEVPGVGTKVVKWFGVMRPIDLDTF